MKHVYRTLIRAVVVGLALLLPLVMLPRADAAEKAPGQSSLAALLTAHGTAFDHNWRDFDITTNAVLAVIAARPGSKVALLADGSVPLTAFLPTDRAFQRLGKALTGHRFTDESKLFTALVKTLGVDTIEKVLMYHVVPGVTIDSSAALKANRVHLGTALKKQIIVHVRSQRKVVIFLGDKDPNARNPRLIPSLLDLNKGNLQIAHGINRVLRPADL